MLRIEDIDQSRMRPEFMAGIFEDLDWLGLNRDPCIRVQSDHITDYAGYLDRLKARGLLYPCFCTRKQIAREILQSARAPHGPDGMVYPGTCRALSADERTERIAAGQSHAWRLDITAALARTGPLFWHDLDHGMIRANPAQFGDVVLARKDCPGSYHLAVTADDAAQQVSLVTRGADLREVTHIHTLLQSLFDLPRPAYRFHRLLTDPSGRRLAKRDKAITLRYMRQQGADPGQIRRDLGF